MLHDRRLVQRPPPRHRRLPGAPHLFESEFGDIIPGQSTPAVPLGTALDYSREAPCATGAQRDRGLHPALLGGGVLCLVLAAAMVAGALLRSALLLEFAAAGAILAAVGIVLICTARHTASRRTSARCRHHGLTGRCPDCGRYGSPLLAAMELAEQSPRARGVSRSS